MIPIHNLIDEINDSVKDINIDLHGKFDETLFPVFIIGSPRAGTTLVYQAIVSKFNVEYPSNLVARFCKKPVLGYALQKNICSAEPYTSNFKSHHGYSVDKFLEPHECGYFWSRWFSSKKSHHTPIDTEVDDGLKTTIDNLLRLSGKVWVFKNLTLGLKIPILKKIFPNAKFIIVRRNLILTALSILSGREERYNDRNHWWSLMLKEIDTINNLTAEEQVIAQIYYTYN